MNITCKELLQKNIAWIIGILFLVGVTYQVIQTVKDKVVKNSTSIENVEGRIENAEKVLTKLTYIEQDINDIKLDIRDIKNVILEPVYKAGKAGDVAWKKEL